MKTKYFFIFTVTSLLTMKTFSQNIFGIYSLTGIHDMAATFKLNEDSTFNFFYAYGAVDRFADGSFTVSGNQVILKSSKQPGNDFSVDKQYSQNDELVIEIKNNNTLLASNVLCICVKGEERQEFYADKKGKINAGKNAYDKVYLQHLFYPDIPTLIRDSTNKNNYFEVSLKPSLERISFKGIDLTIYENTLTCLPNYFMPFEKIVFVKQKEE